MGSKTDFLPEIVSKKNQVWYMEDVDISYSFSSLEILAEKLGAKVEKGDILVVDNENRDKRKIYKKIADGRAVILYLMTPKKNKFLPLHKKGRGLVGMDSMLRQGIFE